MTNATTKAVWRSIGASVIGASHRRAQARNQDALWPHEPAGGPPLILAVSDGHGNAQSFRSHLGAERAVQAATTTLQAFYREQRDSVDLTVLASEAAERLPEMLVQSWLPLVTEDWTREPFSDEEMSRLEEKEGTTARHAVEANPVIAYGSTALAVLVAESYLLYLQIGDGDILTVAEDGKVSSPLPRDPRLIANETTSLCSRKAARYVQTLAQPVSESLPALILLATDGYSNSYRDDRSFRKVGSDLWKLICKHGLEKVHSQLETWLTETSEAGSSDDITLGLLCRMDALHRGSAEGSAKAE